jgi:exosortase
MSRFEWAIVVLLLLGWIPGILALAKVWGEVEYASHGFLVPLVALWTATAHREKLAQLAKRPMPGGLIMMGCLAPLTAAAVLFGNASLIGLLAVVTVVLAVLALRGAEWVQTLSFPLGYLVFMIPLPISWVTPVIVDLQLWVSNLAVRLLQTSGFSIYREGNVLVLPGDLSLFVAEACSGITSLITLLPIGVFIAYFTDSVPWRRVALVLCVIPIALAGNLLRVVLTVLLASEVSLEIATEGPLHLWAGVGTYAIGCVCLIGVGKMLRQLGPTQADPLQPV